MESILLFLFEFAFEIAMEFAVGIFENPSEISDTLASALNKSINVSRSNEIIKLILFD